MGARRGLKVYLAGQALACLACASLSAQVPKYVTGDECLFCHRVKVADTWEKNPHGRTVHPRDDGDPVHADATLVLGAHPPQRGLKPDGYGKFDLLSSDGKTWDKQAFALRCAGCHTTAVDPQTHSFSASSLDCYTCHGVAPENHPNDTSLIWFSKKHSKDPKQVVSICAQCHLRDGKAKSDGLPYPNNFVAGGDLFADFQLLSEFLRSDARHHQFPEEAPALQELPADPGGQQSHRQQHYSGTHARRVISHPVELAAEDVAQAGKCADPDQRTERIE